jgi:hypothetical protein
MTVTRRFFAIAATISLSALALGSTAAARADDELPVFRPRRCEPFVTPDPRRNAPSLAEAIGGGLLPPFDWGWYGFGGYPGVSGWGWGTWGGYGGLSWGRYPYPYGFNGRFWYPNGPTWPYGSLAPNLGPSHFGPLPPMSYSIHPLYPLQFPYTGGATVGNGVDAVGPYYW